MNLHLRRMESTSGVHWALFREGNIYEPIALLDPRQMEILIEEYEQQEEYANHHDCEDRDHRS